MVEYASVRSSLYDIDSLVGQLNERAGDGWEVVQILPTGGDVTAVLRRSPEPEPTSTEPAYAADAAFVATTFDDTSVDTTPAVPEAEAEVPAEPDMDVEPAVDEVVVDEVVIEETAPEEPKVEEPAGWGAAPVVEETLPETKVEETTPEAPADTTADTGDTSTYAPVVDDTPPPPEPEPVVTEPVVTEPVVSQPVAEPVAEPAPAAATPAPPSPPPAPATPSIPAGWYPDPSGRYELRYWDGNAWSEHTARQGQMYTDPPVA